MEKNQHSAGRARGIAMRRAIPGMLVYALIGGCALQVGGSFSPVRGPLAEVKPAPNYPARMTGALSGTISVNVPGDGSCAGSWSGTRKQPRTFDLSADWNLVYGPGYYAAHVLGDRLFVRTTLECSGGSVMRVEVSNEYNRPGYTHGVAEDDHGNVFKISVYN